MAGSADVLFRPYFAAVQLVTCTFLANHARCVRLLALGLVALGALWGCHGPRTAQRQRPAYVSLPPFALTQPLPQQLPKPFEGGSFGYVTLPPMEKLPELPTPQYTPQPKPEVTVGNRKVEVAGSNEVMEGAPVGGAPKTPAEPPAYQPIYAGAAETYNQISGTASEGIDEDAFYNAILAEFEPQPGDSDKMLAFKALKDSLDQALTNSGYTQEQIRKFYILNYLERKPLDTASTQAPGLGAHGALVRWWALHLPANGDLRRRGCAAA